MKGIVLVLVVCCVGVVLCGRDYKWECKKKPMMHIGELYDAMDVCKKMGVTDLFCQSVCGAKHFKMLDMPMGNINETELLRRAEHHLAEPESKMVQEKLKECAKVYGPMVMRSEAGLGTADMPPFCLTRYFPFWTCIWVSAMQICETQFDPEIIGTDKITMKSTIEPPPAAAVPK